MAKKDERYQVIKNFDSLRKGRVKTRSDLRDLLSGSSCEDYDRIASYAGEPSVTGSSYPGARQQDVENVLNYYIGSLRALGIIKPC